MNRRLLQTFAGILALLAIVYAGDSAVVRYRIAANRDPFGQAIIQSLYVIHQKNGKIDYQMGDKETATCIRSLFPHLGYSPCWYLNRHTEKRIDI
jgi:hypothetical protein